MSKLKFHKLTLLAMAISFGFLFSACIPGIGDKQNADQSNNSPLQEKSGDTTKTGVVSASAGKFYLQEPGGSPLEIDSYSLDLNQYAGKTVTVTGQYSGNTLFVGSIK